MQHMDTPRGVQERRCNVYAIIKEAASGSRVTVCAGETRNRHLYTSVSNTVEIQIVDIDDSDDQSAYFTIAFQGIWHDVSKHQLTRNEARKYQCIIILQTS